jgi:hypothetical protein
MVIDLSLFARRSCASCEAEKKEKIEMSIPKEIAFPSRGYLCASTAQMEPKHFACNIYRSRRFSLIFLLALEKGHGSAQTTEAISSFVFDLRSFFFVCSPLKLVVLGILHLFVYN